jgi:pilus assembly protein FimV
VDLNLEGGDSRVDLELLTPPGGEEGIDLDLGEALDSSDAEAETGEAEILDFDLEEGADRGTSPTAEMPRVGDQTAEMPAVDGTRLQPVSPDATAELAMDDLGIDLGELDALSGGAPEDDVTRLMPADEATRRMPAGEGGMDFDLGELSPEVSAAGTEEVTQVVDVGRALTEDTSEFTATEQISLDELPQMPELEPVTMSEVGTKLDLARAYVDMGDPDGARSILEEVLKEGSASQKQEAQRLLDSLPGA